MFGDPEIYTKPHMYAQGRAVHKVVRTPGGGASGTPARTTHPWSDQVFLEKIIYFSYFLFLFLLFAYFHDFWSDHGHGQTPPHGLCARPPKETPRNHGLPRIFKDFKRSVEQIIADGSVQVDGTSYPLGNLRFGSVSECLKSNF